MGGGSSKQADVKLNKSDNSQNKKSNYKPGQAQAAQGTGNQGQIQEMDKRRNEAAQQMLAAQQQREALLRQQQEDSERVENERHRKLQEEQEAILAKQKEDEQKAHKPMAVPYTPPQKKQGDKEQQKLEEMKRLMNERKQKEAILKKQREEQEMQLALKAAAQKAQEQAQPQTNPQDMPTMNKQSVIGQNGAGSNMMMNNKQVIGNRMGADSEDSDDNANKRQFGRKESNLRLFQAQVSTVQYGGGGGNLPGGAMSRSPNPLLMNQKQVMAGLDMENALCDHEANRKIDMNELKSLLA